MKGVDRQKAVGKDASRKERVSSGELSFLWEQQKGFSGQMTSQR